MSINRERLDALVQALYSREQWLFRCGREVHLKGGSDGRLLVVWSENAWGGMDDFMKGWGGTDYQVWFRREAHRRCSPCLRTLVEGTLGRKLEHTAYFYGPSRGFMAQIVTLEGWGRADGGEPPAAGNDAGLAGGLRRIHEAMFGIAPPHVHTIACGSMLAFGMKGILTREERAATAKPGAGALEDSAPWRAALAGPFMDQIMAIARTEGGVTPRMGAVQFLALGNVALGYILLDAEPRQSCSPVLPLVQAPGR